MSVPVGSLKYVATDREGQAMIQPEGYRSWRSGKLVPGRIALARGYLNLPQQSVAYVCGTDAETVDLWEQGAEYPAWAELIDLTAFTGYSIQFFTRPVTGAGPRFAIPYSWGEERGEITALRDEFCTVAIEAAVYGWPREEESLVQSMFV